MKVVLASQSALKIDVCTFVLESFFTNAELITVKAASGVAEQPMNDETLQGARNRIADAKEKVPDADLYISIENGIFEERGLYVDRGLTLIHNRSGDETQGLSDGVIYPREAVEATRMRGFDRWTVGKVMAETGVVTQHDDPHKDLSGKSRKDYLIDAVSAALSKLNRPTP